MKASIVAALLLAGTGIGFSSEEAPPGDIGIPYNTVNKTMIPLKSRKVDGIFCVPWYLKDERKDTTLDPEKARFRVATWEGTEVPLKVEALASVPPDELTEKEKTMMKGGFTHRMWVPKADKRFLDGSMLHSLPRGAVAMAQSLEFNIDKKSTEDKKPAND